MADHFKLEITNRSTKITTWTDVSPNFAEEYRDNLMSSDDEPFDDKPMSDVLATVFSS